MSTLDWPQGEERLALAATVLAMTEGSQLLTALDASGIPWIGIAEEEGGSGGDAADLAVAIRLLAGLARDNALSETGFVSAWALQHCGFAAPNRHIAPAFDLGTEVTANQQSGTWHITGKALQVPGTVGAECVLLPVRRADAWGLALVPIAEVELSAGVNLAGESRADMQFHNARAELLLELPSRFGWTDLHARLGLARAIQISGAMLATRELTVNYACTREQFGKPIAEQQAVAHMLASIAEQALLAEGAVATAINAPTTWNCAIAKSVASRAARHAAATSHQVHGAMGMSQEYPLGRLTTRLWSWAEEGGRPEAWESWIGSRFMQQDQPQIWESVVNAVEGRNP